MREAVEVLLIMLSSLRYGYCILHHYAGRREHSSKCKEFQGCDDFDSIIISLPCK